MSTVGKNIQALRKKKGLTQETLADQLHVTRQAVSNWETGKTEPDLETLQTVAAAVDAEFLELIYGPGHCGNTEVSVYPRFQRKHVIACVLFGLVSLLCFVLRLTWIPKLKETMAQTLIAFPLLRAHLLTACLLGFCVAALFPSFVSLLADIHVCNHHIRYLLLISGLALLAIQVLYIAATLYQPLAETVNFLFYQWIPSRITWFCFFSYPVAPFFSGLCIGWWSA
ncbi:MAG: helix-turn-helix transcriptional regulator [Oscillospiraceae bacterium]|jgi:transcriptional regulator with XRE-family HTH domain